MKTILTLVTILLLSGCTTIVPVKQKFPDAPTPLLEKCPELNQAGENSTDITEFLKVIIKNYQLYYECSNKQEGWVDWYNGQKRINK